MRRFINRFQYWELRIIWLMLRIFSYALNLNLNLP